MAHRNSLSNDEPHHLYEIRDKVDDDVFKYGISSDPIEDDGLSKRIRVQLDLLNLVDRWARFFANILVFDIQGREEALRMEDDFIKKYEKEYGKRPRGNR